MNIEVTNNNAIEGKNTDYVPSAMFNEEIQDLLNTEMVLMWTSRRGTVYLLSFDEEQKPVTVIIKRN